MSNPPPSFQSSFIPHPLSSASRIHLVSCDAPASKSTSPLLLVHGLGSSASFWLPALSTAQGKTLTSERQVYAIDAYGHGVSDFVSAEDSLDRAAETVVGVIEYLLKESGQDKVILAGHSMSGLVTSLVAARRPDIVSKLFLLSPTLSLPSNNRESLRTRAQTVTTPQGHLDISSVVSTTGISPSTHAANPFAAPFIKHLILTTNPSAYAQACSNLASHPGWDADVESVQCEVFILSGSEDYMVSVAEVEKRAAQVPGGKGKFSIMQDVGHWGGLEVPEKVAEALVNFIKA
ncbi:hypothetical protein NliqN6_6474 [Naganishia liquefaciens]|uniref:AB hydrolase-1 domain-containing protein n=1 Tax=Naganishia liquefaciens TaxID=104408 RepID=A0A8H3YJD7_9TREE|nr:hypothetical protein NliqN6_6474 [Naganishia liquefaciens]